MSSLAMYFPDNFDMNNFKVCGKLTEFAYEMYTQWINAKKPRKEDKFDWNKPTLEGFNFSNPIWSHEKWLHIINESEPFGFVAQNKSQNKTYLVYRGTESTSDWVNDIDATQTEYPFISDMGSVHSGFLKLYQALREDQMKILQETVPTEELYITGHSLGCGLTTLAVPDVAQSFSSSKINHYNFASPRVGDPIFTDQYNQKYSLAIRMVNTCDVVPNSPLSVMPRNLFKHIGIPVNYTAQYGGVADNHSLTDSYMYALNNPNSPENS